MKSTWLWGECVGSILINLLFAVSFCRFHRSRPADDTGRLSKSEIERMVADAEKFADEDRKVQERSAAKGKLETFAYGLKHAVEDQKVRQMAGGRGVAQIKAAPTFVRPHRYQ